MLSAQPNIAVTSPFTGLQQSQDKLPPAYEEAHLAVQSLDSEKNAIYRHPLFPLLAMLLEKCEIATQTSECPTSVTFDNDIKNYIIQHNRDGKPFFTDDQELDNLIVKAIQVFRIHLLELEKVNELCKDFCQRYIACLKGKMQSDNLLRSPLSSSYPTQIPSGISQAFQQLPTTSPPQHIFLQQPQQQQQQPQTPQLTDQQVTFFTTSGTPCSVAIATPPSGSVISQPVQQVASTAYIQQQPTQPIAVSSTPTPPSPVSQTGQTFVLTQLPSTETPYSMCSTATTPVTTSPTTPTSSISAGSPLEITVPTPIPLPSLDLDSPTETTERKKTKRGVLPKQATNIMKQWLFSHLMHPYPTEDEKRSISLQTNLTILQVNNWFINARRRILQPMLDAGNPDAHKAKKSKIQSRPAQRFWPESLVQQYRTVPIAPNHLAGQVIPNAVVQTVPTGSIPVQTLVNSGGIIPGAVQLPPNFTLQQGNIVIVTLPPSASTIYTVTNSTSTQSAQTTNTSSTATTHVETTSTENLVPILSTIQQESPAVHGSPLPTMVHNGIVSRGEYQIVGSPHAITAGSTPTSGDTIVHTLSMESSEVASRMGN
ncbi:homeobox protein PKNOX2-like isoform X2 [Actinia tenebrosa]|nr:homeobox protein PKNOX2-like isoform X2 [Actinia tenebrosa]